MEVSSYGSCIMTTVLGFRFEVLDARRYCIAD